MKSDKETDAIIKEIELMWAESYREIIDADNHWWIDTIEKGFYYDCLDDMALSEDYIDTVLKDMGY